MWELSARWGWDFSCGSELRRILLVCSPLPQAGEGSLVHAVSAAVSRCIATEALRLTPPPSS
ncbi:hypothetical protein CBM2637_B40089 [Cupriavidus taiwanensis]|nr:hypothetical protein CBM2637_B40089 [Cupriavidus taiwanensis]